MKIKRTSFLTGAFALMVSGLVVRLLGFVYRVYLSNAIGAEGIGLISLISPVYSLIILTLTAGISISVSKLTAEELAKGNRIKIRRITSTALGIVLAAGLFAAVVVRLNAGFVCEVILKDSRAYYSMLLLAPCIPIVAAASAIKGYFYGTQEIVPTAVSQIAEQVAKISFVMILSAKFTGMNLEASCAFATAGMAFGEIANLAVVSFKYLKNKKYDLGGCTRQIKQAPSHSRGQTKQRAANILKIAAPISANRFILSALGLVEAVLIPRMLVFGGLDHTSSMQAFGRLNGMAMPLIYFPGLVTSSLATTLVPAVSEAVSRNNFRLANHRISLSVRLSLVLGFLFFAVYASFSEPICKMIYKDQEVGQILSALAVICIFTYLAQTLSGIMNGLNRQNAHFINTLICGLLRIGTVIIIVPRYSIRGYIYGMILSSACACILNLLDVTKTTGIAFDIRGWVFKPGITACVVWLMAENITRVTGTSLISPGVSGLLIAAAVTAMIYLLLMLMMGVISRDDLKLIKAK
jgi:stage V sporulation protein B